MEIEISIKNENRNFSFILKDGSKSTKNHSNPALTDSYGNYLDESELSELEDFLEGEKAERDYENRCPACNRKF